MMSIVKIFGNFLWVCLAISNSSAQFISEFHYDNIGTGTGEFVEVFLPDPQPGTASQYRIYLYNGNDSLVYESRGLQGIMVGCDARQQGCYYVWERTTSFVQDGPRDGIALVFQNMTDTVVFDFISYEGVLRALGGPAKGMISSDIGISENNSTPIGWSLQKRSDDTWFAGPSTRGAVNPIELLSFEGKYFEDAEGVVLTWRTASELNNHFFEVQRSDDQRSFYALTEVEGAGHSQELQSYTYVDQNIDQPQIYYRLKQVDYDGSFAYSPVITVTVDGPERAALAHINPVLRNNQEIYLPRSDYRHPVDLMIYDGLGRQLFYQKQMKQGDCTPFRYASSGILFYRIQSRGQTHAGRLLALDH
ncbi:hypothetical protein KUV50_02135 [Membranicola marinus]|uniref:Uncharacterized protein n=1 Tax=Membranihabitans marinus TaxID=1227546 RepID=A0A953HRE7_9BACT|nr:hypothetical protein [Membranihabitans marinus]MBY5956916.1 hypothetical protein [Membranihabitans marinus]